MKIRRIVAIVLTLVMLLSLAIIIPASAEEKNYYKAYDVVISETDGISFKFDFDETGHNKFVRCDMEICVGTSATDPSTAFPGLGMPYKNTLKTDKGQADLIIDKTNDVATITVHPEEIDLTGIDEDHQHVWMMTRPCYTANALDTLSDGKGGAYYNDFIYLGQYASAQDFKDIKMISSTVTVDDEMENGTVSLPSSINNEDDIVEITVTPDEGYKVDKVFVDDEEIAPDEDGKYTFIMPDHDVTIKATFKYDCKHDDVEITADGNKISLTCSDDKCDLHTEPLTLTLTPPSNLVSNGKSAKEVTFAEGEKEAWIDAGLELPEVVYTAKDGSKLTNGKPVNAGEYTATITVGDDKIASLDFTIIAGDENPNANPKTAETNDASGLGFWTILLTLSSAGICTCLILEKKEFARD